MTIGGNLLTHTATIERASETERDSGWPNRSWSTVATGVRCSLQPVSDRIRTLQLGTSTEGSNWRLYVNGGTDIAKGDRVTISSVAYEVRELNDAAGRSHHYEAVLRLFEGR